jgi:putative ABC transport system ATP-binding protein
VNDPLILLADEPTGNLDSASGGDIFRVFDDLHRQGKTLILVTHDPAVGARTHRAIRLRDGRVETDTRT